jgi:von Willebrand factor type A domain
VVVLLLLIPYGWCEFDEARFQQVVDKMERDVNEFAQQIESLYPQRCEALVSCAERNYHHCVSSLPSSSATCQGGQNLNIFVCGNSSTCNSKYDYNESTIRLPTAYTTGTNSNPQDPSIIESICFSRGLDDWFQDKRARDAAYWSDLGDAPRAMYFGSVTGAFRIYPARPSDNCDYDPRIRPWYIAASSGPKNVVMVLDISGSMKEPRIGQLKLAAKRIVETLTESDTFNVVIFHTNATLINPADPNLIPATADNKQRLIELIENLQIGFQTNFLDAFDLAFNVLEDSVFLEQQACASSRSNTAILFFTDGAMDVPSTNTTPVTELINRRIANLSDRLNIVSAGDTEIDIFPSEIACAVPQGVWSKILSEEEIVDSLLSYHKLFALGLADSNFTAWVAPYACFTGNTLCTSVAVPVYDRTTDPPRFLGVVAIDFGLTALISALGGSTADIETAQEESIRLIALQSTYKCPALDLSQCELEAYRRLELLDSTCPSNCASDIVFGSSESCVGVSFPESLWENTDAAELSYIDRACCNSEETVEFKEQCQLYGSTPSTLLTRVPVGDMAPPSQPDTGARSGASSLGMTNEWFACFLGLRLLLGIKLAC